MPAPDRLAELLHPSQPAWLRAGMADWLATGDPLHLCLAIDRASAARALRNAHLVDAWQALSGPAGWPRALVLSNELRQFASRVWPRVRDLAEPDPSWSALKTALWHAFTANGELKFPYSPDSMRLIVENAGLYIQENPPENAD